MKVSNFFIATLSLAVAISATASAQSTGPVRVPSTNTSGENETSTIKGTVVSPGGSPLEAAVRVTLQDLRGSPITVFTDYQGRFEMRGIAPGTYLLEADGDNDKYDPGSVRVDVHRQTTTVATISLVAKRATKPTEASGTTVSTGEITANVPVKAKQEFEKASKAVREGKTAEAIGYLRKAISIYPDYLAAHNDLGAQLLETGEFEEAQAEFEKAIEIDPNAFNPYLNLGILSYRTHEFAEAMTKLNKAVSIKSDSAHAYFYRGLVHIALQENGDAIKDLKTSHDLGGSALSTALFYLGQVYMDTNQRMQALDSFVAFLRESPNSANAAEARRIIALLR